MPEFTPSSSLDDLLSFGDPRTAPTPVVATEPNLSSEFNALITPHPAIEDSHTQPQYLTRRQLREAETRAADKLDRAAERLAIAQGVTEPSARATRRRRAALSSAPSRRLRRAEVRRIHAAVAKHERKHPAAVLVTMSMVVGVFAVATLPAYATTPQASQASQANSSRVSFDASGQSMVVSPEAVPLAALRDGYAATTSEEIAAATEDDVRASNTDTYLLSGARELGDDYPWYYERGEEQGGGLSVLNYYYRQCTDFVAWRLNRDAGSTKAPFKWVWSQLTPSGGNASQWKYAWEQHGWPISDTPQVGWVAWWGSINHVAYVKSVDEDAETVTVEEYNFVTSVYGQRTVPISSVEGFLSPLPD